jgi:glutathione-regulated potassium-efflux system ancillary protein KefG
MCRQYLVGLHIATSVGLVTRKVDPGDLIDAAGVAELLGLTHRNSIRVYRTRYVDFPPPVVDMGKGRCLLWLRTDIEQWAKTTGRRGSDADEVDRDGPRSRRTQRGA